MKVVQLKKARRDQLLKELAELQASIEEDKGTVREAIAREVDLLNA